MQSSSDTESASEERLATPAQQSFSAQDGEVEAALHDTEMRKACEEQGQRDHASEKQEELEEYALEQSLLHGMSRAAAAREYDTDNELGSDGEAGAGMGHGASWEDARRRCESKEMAAESLCRVNDAAEDDSSIGRANASAT